MMTESSSEALGEVPASDELSKVITGDLFRTWRHKQEVAQNIREGTPYFNGPTSEPPPEKHSPSRLLQCHRKIYYRCANAPKEQREPAGIFWFGSQFETELAVPFLRDVVGPDQFVRNSMWVDYTIDTDDGPLTVRGETDPVIVDRNSTPLVLTEIKTTSSVDSCESPKLHHKAQAHAYMYGLAHEYECDLRDALIIYGARDSLEVAVCHVPFDPVFWRDGVLQWAATNTGYRATDELPPANPEFGWECEFCSYRKRCGQTDSPFVNLSPMGLLPLTKYPRKQVEEYLEAHPEEMLTPSLAHNYRDLAEEHGVLDWHCEVCGAMIPWDSVDWDGYFSSPPTCPKCSGSAPHGVLTGPHPARQSSASDDRTKEDTHGG